jgi:hypothetical protein
MNTKAEDTAAETRRSFEYTVDGDEKEFFLQVPNSEQINKAEWHYSKVYNKALVEGVATTAEMIDILTTRGLYGPDYEKKLQELQVNIAVKLAEMHNATEDDKKEALAMEVANLRDELYRWNQRITGPLSNSCEQMAEDAKTEYLTSVCVFDAAGNSVWDSYDAFVGEKNQGLALRARFEVLLWLQGLDADFLDKTPENKVLRELALQRAEAEAKAATPQLEASSAEEEEPKKAKRKPRKKAAAKAVK